jgi:hypothetical protein
MWMVFAGGTPVLVPVTTLPLPGVDDDPVEYFHSIIAAVWAHPVLVTLHQNNSNWGVPVYPPGIAS